MSKEYVVFLSTHSRRTLFWLGLKPIGCSKIQWFDQHVSQ